MALHTEMDGSVCWLTLSNPPVNALSIRAGIVGALQQAIDLAIADKATSVIVIKGDNHVFCAGADIGDFEAALERLDELRNLLNTIEASPKPVIAAIEGHCLGGGLELALAAHYRVAHKDAVFAFPEIGLGLLPGAGGTQRAPRLIGALAALDMMLGGRSKDAAWALTNGLIDQAGGESVDELVRSFLSARSGSLVPRPISMMAMPDDTAEALAQARTGKELSLAGNEILRLVEEASDRDFAASLDAEADAFATLAQSLESRALRHGFFGRRQVARIKDVPKAKAEIAQVTIVGGGLMGCGIAVALLNAGLQVDVVEPSEERRPQAQATIEKTIHRDVKKGRIDDATADARLAALAMVGTLESARPSDLYIEAVFEDIAVKREVFSMLDKVAPAGAILASNTSTLDLDEIASFTSRPEQVLGLHFFSPANIMRLLEIVRGEATSPDVIARALSFAKMIRKTGVVAGVCDGFIGNRIFEEYLRQAWFLLEEGALPQQVDKALEHFGMAMGPCRVMDLAGQDIGWKIRQRRAVDDPDRPYSRVPDLICEQGRFGQKTGAGFYQYPNGRTPEIDPAVEALILAESERAGVERRMIDDTEIVERCIYAMVLEGARILEEGIAQRPVDIDITYIDGYGFPPSKGGPMFYADEVGLSAVCEAAARYRQGHHGWAWDVPDLIQSIADKGGNLMELNVE